MFESYESLPILVEGDRLPLVEGEFGITGLLAFPRPHLNVKLLYGVKFADERLLTALKDVIGAVRERDMVVGKRLDFVTLLRDGAALGWSRIAVIFCGPNSMYDDVRTGVACVGRETAGRSAV
ncbi:hypothetical protein F5Y08DRAFT_199300 [Xylaria arbuscula]|uniref:Uncharacterized protein n=1 Tax=Xylaria arbuscula TaxID=114810 RepID=A0A9W8NFV3_9PEZI|nr:hypothetical protein F5Y08DRAFT_199300 [Xylaria arbuscula]KAJ3573263.1 hypothetical protein NPX13_g4763 [Xylaria arbuscula]